MVWKSMERLDKILQSSTHPQSGSIHAAAFIAVDKSGKVIYRYASGRLKLLERDGSPMETTALCWGASLTKLATSIAVMQLVEQGILDLDQDVRGLVPELADMQVLVGFEQSIIPISCAHDLVDESKHDNSFGNRKPILKPPTGPLTLRHLLSHTSGCCYDMQNSMIQEWSAFEKRTVNGWCGSMDGYRHPLIFDPGASWAYGSGLEWAGLLVQKVCRMTLEEYMQKYIWSKIGARNSTFHPEALSRSLSPQVQMALRTGVENNMLEACPIILNCPTADELGGLGLFTTAEDYAMLLSALICENSPLLRTSSIDTLITPQLNSSTRKALLRGLGRQTRRLLEASHPDDDKYLDYCLAGVVTLRDLPKRRSKGSVSWAGLPNMHWWIDRKEGIAAAFFTQIMPPGDAAVTDIVMQLEEALYGALREQRQRSDGEAKL